MYTTASNAYNNKKVPKKGVLISDNLVMWYSKIIVNNIYKLLFMKIWLMAMSVNCIIYWGIIETNFILCTITQCTLYIITIFIYKCIDGYLHYIFITMGYDSS